jgi:hypothetical protein
MAYTIAFAQSVREQLLTLTARQRVTVLDAIEEQLSHQPLVETKTPQGPGAQPGCAVGIARRVFPSIL